MKIKFCDKCGKRRWDNSPYSYTWWGIQGIGLCCYKCHQKWAKRKKTKK